MIGIIYPFSGSSAQIGVDAQKAFETAAEVINNKYDFDLPLARDAGLPGLGGAKIRLVFADHQADPQKGRAEAERLITQEKVCAIIGTYQSAVAVTVSQTCERYQIPFISADNSSPSLHRRGLKFYFRAAPHDEMFSKAMFDFFDAMKKKGQKIETLSLFHEDTIFGTDSGNAQLKLANDRGYKVLADIKYRANSPSLSAEVQQLKAANADVLMPSSYTTDGILLVKTMAELGYKPNAIVAQDAGFSEKALYDAVGDKLEGVISRGSFSLDLAAKRPMVGKINAMFKEKSGKDLNDFSSRQFMGLIVMADAINRAKSTDGDKITRSAGGDRHAGRANDHAVEAREVRRDGPEQRRRSGAAAIYRRQVRHHLPAASRRRRSRLADEVIGEYGTEDVTAETIIQSARTFRHCEDAQRRSNPFFPSVARWIASLRSQ